MLLLAATLVAGGLTAGSAAGAKPPGAVPNVTLDRLIHTDQLQLVNRSQQIAVATARGAVERADQTLATAESTLARDRQLVSDAGRVRAAAESAVRRDTATLSAEVTAHRRAVGHVDADRRALQAVAIGWYTGGAALIPSPQPSLAATQAAADADTELALLAHLSSIAFRRDTAAAGTTGRAVREATTIRNRDRAVLATDVSDAADATDVVSAAAGVVATDSSSLGAVTAALDAATARQARAVAAFDGSEKAGPAPVPSILGPAALTAPEMAAWFTSTGDAAATRASVRQLTSWYISEGRAEGVRGDIAFAQAMVETGGFDSSDAVVFNNFAGIGHCNTCASGVRFPSALTGVRGQVQLLRTYADPTLTSADLPSPPPVAGLAPQDQRARGCCSTWNSLTGVWATDTAYGATILEVYASMLGFAVDRLPAVPST
jgi:hypothetical protein